VELRESPLRRTALIGLIVALAAIFFFVWTRTQDYRIIEECRARYRVARTIADSATIDQDVIVGTKSEAVSPISCGTLRRQNRL